MRRNNCGDYEFIGQVLQNAKKCRRGVETLHCKIFKERDQDNSKKEEDQSNVSVEIMKDSIAACSPHTCERDFVENFCAVQGCVKLPYSFYNVPCQELARKLLGKILVRSLKDGPILKGRIVETECYLGGEDKASHSYNGKVTPRNKPMYMKPATTYVYFTYGMYFCFNISSQGDGAAVLVRAVEPLEGHGFMNLQRINKRMSMKKNLKSFSVVFRHHDLCNGPGKLCISFCIDVKSCNMQDLCSWEEMWIESDRESELVSQGDIITSTRIGINSAGTEWALQPLRFYVFGNRSVSRCDKKKEEERQKSISE